MKNKMYVVVREDLDPGLRTAQACHAATLYGRDFGASEEQNLIVLGVPDKEQLAQLLFELERRHIPKVWFKEPDVDNELTALACPVEATPLVRNLPLLFQG